MGSLMQTFALVEMSISCAVFITWFLQKLSFKEWPLFPKIVLVMLLANLFFWPLDASLELPLAAYIRGITGDLSIVSLLLLWGTLLDAGKPVPLAFKLAVAMIAVVFYPLALGLGMVDPYAWGYGSIAFLLTGVKAFGLSLLPLLPGRRIGMSQQTSGIICLIPSWQFGPS
jgi:hypothetical protein